MSDEYQIETRRRSRSKTPFLRSSCDHENCEHAGEEGHIHHKKKPSVAPTVHTIHEEHVMKSISSKSHGGSKTNAKVDAAQTSEYSSDDTFSQGSSQQQKQQQKKQQSTSTVTTMYKQTRRTLNNVLGDLSASKQNALNFAQEYVSSKQQLQQHSTPLGNGSADSSEHLPYLEYKKAGEYWNTTPKTDYTYSELSTQRRMLAPGVVAMPNMSRRSLENHDKRVNSMVQQRPEEEEFIRRRYQSHYTHKTHLNYDSTDEVDITRLGQSTQSWWLLRLITTILSSVSTIWTRIINISGNTSDSEMYRTYYAKRQQQRGFFGRTVHGVGSGVMTVVRALYLFIASVLSLDVLLLRSSNPNNKGKKRFLLLLLLLLPLLLLTAWSQLQEEQRVQYADQIRSLLPLPFALYATLRSQVGNAGASLKSLLQLPALSWPYANEEAREAAAIKLEMHNIEQNIQKSLSPEEYESILNHVNSYVQQLVELKLVQQRDQQEREAQQLTPQQINIIVQLMRENLEQFAATKLKLSDAEVAILAARLKLLLQESGDWGDSALPLKLSAEQIDEIRKLITVELKIQQQSHYKILLDQDWSGLLHRLLTAPELAEFVDARIHLAIDERASELQLQASGAGADHGTFIQFERQHQIIDELNKEIAFIKLAMSDKHSENADLQQSISALKLTQDDLLQRLKQHELAVDKRFTGLLAEIENKLNSLQESQFTALNKQVKLTLVEILGFKQAATASGDPKFADVDLQNWVRSIFVAKDYLEQQLLEVNKRTDNNIRDEIERSSIVLMNDISERLKREILLAVEAKQTHNSALTKGQMREDEVRNIVKAVLAIYDADKTGLVDFALESAGGQILSTRCTESYQTKSAQISVFGIPLWYPTNTPRVAISPNVQPGECWAFQGFPGFLVLKLNSLVYVTGFTLEHIPRSLSPTGRIDSAPRNFTVWGLEHEKDQDPVLFGEYEYKDSGASLQYFVVQNLNINRPYEIVELRIESNHGQPTYTCLYRFRVHGKPPAT